MRALANRCDFEAEDLRDRLESPGNSATDARNERTIYRPGA